MPGAIILANQPSGAGAGTPGEARKDLWLTKVVNLSVSTSGNSSFSWTMLAKPLASAATLSTPTASTSSFTPDVVGTYRIQLVTNGGGVGNEQTLVYRARYTSTGALANRGWAYPAFGEIDIESNYGGNQRGWAEDLDFILEDVRANLNKSNNLVLDSTVTPDDNTFNTFASAITAANAIEGPVFIDVRGNYSVTSGAYDLTEIRFTGKTDGDSVIIFSGSSTLTALPYSLSRVTLNFNFSSSHTIYSRTDGDTDYLFLYNASFEFNNSNGKIAFSSGSGFDVRSVGTDSNFSGVRNLILTTNATLAFDGSGSVGQRILSTGDATASAEWSLVNGSVFTVDSSPVFLGSQTVFGYPGIQIREFTGASTSYSTNNEDALIAVQTDLAAAPVAVTIPDPTSAGGVQPVQQLIVKDVGGQASTYNITITPAAGLIDGLSSYVISTDRGAVTLFSDGTDYHSISSSASGVTADFIYDVAATASGSLYNDFDKLYTAASLLPGVKRVYLRSTLSLSTDYELTDGWEFNGRDLNDITSNIALTQRILNLSGGNLTTSTGGYVLLESINLVGNGGSLYAGSTSFISGKTTFIHARNSTIQGGTSHAIQMGTGGPAPVAAILLENSTITGVSSSACGISGGIARIVIRDSDVSSAFALNAPGLFYLQYESGATPAFSGSSPWTGGLSSNYLFEGNQNHQSLATNTATISSSQNNYAPYAWPITQLLRITASTTSLSITGFNAPTTVVSGETSHGQAQFYLSNVGTNSFSLSHDVTSTAVNRILCPGNTAYTLAAGVTVKLVYDFVSTRWRVVDTAVSTPAAGFGISVSGSTVSQKTTVTALTDASTVLIDAATGPLFSLLATSGVGATRQAGTPSNGAEGQTLRLFFTQDSTGGRLLTFSGNWVNEGRLFQPAQLSNAVSVIKAEARGGTPTWYYTIEHSEWIETTATAISTTDQVDWAPTGKAYAQLVRASASTSSRNLHGIVAPVSGEQYSWRMANVGSFNIVVKNNSSTETTAANRIVTQTGGDLTIQPNDTVDWHYDRASAIWRIF